MVKLESGDIGERSRFPALHRALVALVLVLVTLAYLLWQQGAEFGEPEVVVAQTEVVESLVLPDVQDVPDIEPILEDTETFELIAADSTALEVPSALSTEAQPVLQAPPRAIERTPEPAVVVTPRPPAPVEEVAPVPEIVQEPDPVTEVEVAVAATPQPDTTSRSRDGGWLIRQPEDSFTIQLVTLSSAERADAYLAQQIEAEQFASYRLQRDGRVLHVVVYGIFGSRLEAQAAAERLPGTVGDVRPWVRPMAQVHGAIRTALQ
jgi:septal ring-binding cell division protein DamX